MDTYLAHYGVKGMKWGVRKDRDKSLKNNKFKLTKKQKRLIKTGVICAGSALAIYGSYAVYKSMGQRPSDMRTYGVSDLLKKVISDYPSGDITIDAKTKLHRVSDQAFEDLREKGHTYVSYKFRDNKRYMSSFRKELTSRSGNKDFVHTFTPKSKLRIASPRTVAEMYLKLYPEDEDQSFRFTTNAYTISKSDTALYGIFSKKRKELYSALKNAGFEGYIDIEDASKVKGSSPLILLDPIEHISIKKSRKIGKFETFVAEFLK